MLTPGALTAGMMTRVRGGRQANAADEARAEQAGEVRALRHDMHDADDAKIRRIVAMLEGMAESPAHQVILEPLRARLAMIRPPRPLRFSRLLFTPLDAVIVGANRWRPEIPAIPRHILTAMAGVVRTGMGAEAHPIDALIAGHDSASLEVIAQAGAALWPQAAAILTVAVPPPDWAETGVRPAAFPGLARTIAAVLRRAVALRRLAMDADAGVVKADAAVMAVVLADLDLELPDPCALIARLLLMRAPHAFGLLRRYVSAMDETAPRVRLQKAIAVAIEQILSDLESRAWLNEEIGRRPLDHVSTEVRRITAMLLEIDHDTGGAARRPRIEQIRLRLERACRQRFAAGVKDNVIAPLAATAAPVAGALQTELETYSRDLRMLEMEVRCLGNGESYEHLMRLAIERIGAAAAVGTLSRVRQLRLIEIMAGADAAETLYRGD